MATETLNSIVGVMMQAPSAGNLQAFQVYVIRSARQKQELAAGALDQGFLVQAPVVLVFCADRMRSQQHYRQRGEALYSLQDAIPEAGIRGYHGYAARLSEVVTSLLRVAAEKPDILVPVRGPAITDPQAAIQRLVQRIRALYANYLSIDALRWYFKDEHIRTKARRVLPSDQVNWMPIAETYPGRLPAWILQIDNSRLILAADGSGLAQPLLDIAGFKTVRSCGVLNRQLSRNSCHLAGQHTAGDHPGDFPGCARFYASSAG